MSGIDSELIPDPRQSLIDRHLPGTPQVERLLRKEGKAHVFNDKATMDAVTQAIMERGERTETDADDDYERYGLYFPDSIGYIIRADGSRKLLYYGEIKIVKATGEYHVIPRTGLADKANNWQFVELWVDPIVFPPKILMLVCDQQGVCGIYNPASNYKLMFSSPTYEDAQLWLLEDEYERVDGRLLAEEVA